MSFWSVFSSVDYMDDNSNLRLPLETEAALVAATTALTVPGRVVVERDGDASLKVTTMNHTPAWALLTIFVFFFRRDRAATVTAAPDEDATVLRVRGKLDTRAAARLRALSVAA